MPNSQHCLNQAFVRPFEFQYNPQKMHSEADRPAVTFPYGSEKKKQLKHFFQTVPVKPYICY